MNKRKKGACNEKTAGTFLEMKGCQILAYNYRCRYAEIDLIAMERNTLVFCEVKYRGYNDMEQALQSVTRRKQRRICAAAKFYLAEHLEYTDLNCRFDVIGITDDEIRWIKNAFDYMGG